MLGNHFKMTENNIAAIKNKIKKTSNSKGSPFQPGNCTKLSNCVGAVEDFYTVFINDFEAKRFQQMYLQINPPRHISKYLKTAARSKQ